MGKYNKVKGYYIAGYWSIGMVRNAVGRWITAEEFRDITGPEYQEED